MSWNGSKVQLKSTRELELMRAAGHLVGRILDEIATLAKPGATTEQFDQVARQRIEESGATALFLGVENPASKGPFPAAICASVNEEIVHGVPSNRVLQEGDIVSIDCGVRLAGYCGDSARTYAIGSVDPTAQRLLDVTRESLAVAVREIRPFIRWSKVAAEIQRCIEDAGFGVVREFVGHGIGREMHEEPKIPNYVEQDARSDFEMVPGMTLAVEPMVSVGSPAVQHREPRSWSIITQDRSLAAHFEHTIAVTEDGSEVLTPVGAYAAT